MTRFKPRRPATYLALPVGLLLAVATLPAQSPSLEDVLRRASAYVEGFHQELSGIVAEELYVQQIVNAAGVFGSSSLTPRRQLKSDLLLVRPAGGDRWVEFRDVFEVDGQPVRDRDERLTRLFLDQSASASQQIQDIIAESARYNIGNIVRTINTPTLALTFLESGMQERFRFRRASSGSPVVGGTPGRLTDPDSTVFRTSTEMWVIDYEEVQRGTVIRTPQGRDLPARGRFWIDPDEGIVLMSELVVEDIDLRAAIDVSYQSQPLLGFLVPVEMRERYQARRDRVEGRASYGRFRRFSVQVDEDIPTPTDAR